MPFSVRIGIINMAVSDHCYDNILFPLSNYAKDLSESLKNTYLKKLKYEENGFTFVFPDPYHISKESWITNKALYPRIEYRDVVKYLISLKDYSSACLKNYKSLDAYEYVISGTYSCLFINISYVQCSFVFVYYYNFCSVCNMCELPLCIIVLRLFVVEKNKPQARTSRRDGKRLWYRPACPHS